ncbi:MAG TPA: PaaI family thioesterase [Stellaceae bacterium]|nr:PaaI family thioesterase [Stellaceae bacterium]
MSRITLDEFKKVMKESLPFAVMMGAEVIELSEGRATFRLPYHDDWLRPGGTISGPVLMGLADLAMYAVVLSAVGRVELAVTTNLNINFLRKPAPVDVIAEARMLKLGKRLAVGEVELFSEGDPDMVAHVTATYSIPPR